MDGTPRLSFSSLKGADRGVALGLAALAAVVVAGVGYGLFVMLPLLIELAANTIYFLVELAVLALVGLVVLSPSTWQNVYYKWANISRNIRKSIIHDDPIGTLDTAIARLGKKRDEIAQALADSKAAQLRLSNRVRSRTRDGALDKAEQEEALATAAKKQGRPDAEYNQHVVASDRWRRQADGFQPMLDQLKKMQETMDRAAELADASLSDLKNQRDVLSVELDARKESQKAVGSFKRFFGRSPELEIAGLSIEEIERQSTQAEAEIDQFLTAIQPKLAEADLKKSADTDAALARFNSYADQKALPAAHDAVDGVLVTAVKAGVAR